MALQVFMKQNSVGAILWRSRFSRSFNCQGRRGGIVELQRNTMIGGRFLFLGLKFKEEPNMNYASSNVTLINIQLTLAYNPWGFRSMLYLNIHIFNHCSLVFDMYFLIVCPYVCFKIVQSLITGSSLKKHI